MIKEKRLLKISGKYTLIAIAATLFFWFVIYNMGICHAQTQTGYRIPARLDIGGGRMTGDMWCQYGTNGVRLKIGTQTVTQAGTTGVINGTNATGLPSLDFTYGGGSMSANFNGFNAVYVAGSQVGTSGALTGKLDATGGVGTNNTFNNPTLAGMGTITATFYANGSGISPAEFASVNNATGELQSQIDTVSSSKLSKVNGINTYIGSITAGGKSGTSSFSIVDGLNITTTSTLSSAGHLEVTINSSGSVSSSFSALAGTPTDSIPLNYYIKMWNKDGNNLSPGTTTDSVSVGTTTQKHSGVFTVVGSSTFEGRVFLDADSYMYGTLTTMTGSFTTQTMTSYTAPSGSITVSSVGDVNGAAWQLFDKNYSTAWGTSDPGYSYGTITIDLGTGTVPKITSYQITGDPALANRMAKDWTIRGSTNNTTWSTIETVTGNSAATITTHTITTPDFYRYYRFEMTANNGGAYSKIAEIEFYWSQAQKEAIVIDNINTNGDVLMLLGTPTVFATSTASYVLQTGVGKNILVGAVNNFCFKASKEIVGSSTALEDKLYRYLDTIEIVESHPRSGKTISDEDAENLAMMEFVQSGYSAWKADNIINYTTLGVGTGTINYTSMMQDYQSQKLIEWASDLKQQEKIKEKKNSIEFDRNIVKISPVSDYETTPDEIRGADKRTIDPMSVGSMALNVAKKQKKELEGLKALVGSLTSRLQSAGIP